jgi:hypothetical protein
MISELSTFFLRFQNKRMSSRQAGRKFANPGPSLSQATASLHPEVQHVPIHPRASPAPMSPMDEAPYPSRSPEPQLGGSASHHIVPMITPDLFVATHHQHQRRSSHGHSPATGSPSDSRRLDSAGACLDNTGSGSNFYSPQPGQPHHGDTISCSPPPPLNLPDPWSPPPLNLLDPWSPHPLNLADPSPPPPLNPPSHLHARPKEAEPMTKPKRKQLCGASLLTRLSLR